MCCRRCSGQRWHSAKAHELSEPSAVSRARSLCHSSETKEGRLGEYRPARHRRGAPAKLIAAIPARLDHSVTRGALVSLPLSLSFPSREQLFNEPTDGTSTNSSALDLERHQRVDQRCAAVGIDELTGDPSGIRRAQQRDGVTDVGRRSHPPHRCPAARVPVATYLLNLVR